MIRTFPFHLQENKFETYLTRLFISPSQKNKLDICGSIYFLLLFYLIWLTRTYCFRISKHYFLSAGGISIFIWWIQFLLFNFSYAWYISLLFHFHIWNGKEVLCINMIFKLHYFLISLFSNLDILFKTVL